MTVSPALARIADAALEASVVGSFTSLGFEARRRLFAWPGSGPSTGTDTAALPGLDGQVVLVTGATSGLGLATATACAALGAEVGLVVRDAVRGENARRTIAAATGNDAVFVTIADLSDLHSVRAASDALHAAGRPVHALVHNAGALLHDRRESAQHVEVTLATHVVGPHLFTACLLDLFAPGARVLWVSSGGMYTKAVDLDDLESRQMPYDGTDAYARAKRAQVVLARMWAERLAPRGVLVHAMHPGWADTPGVVESLPRFHRLLRPVLRTPAQGADTIVWLVASDEAGRSSGGFWLDRRPRPTDRVPWTRTDEETRAALWERVTELAGAADLVPDPVG